ncbi:Histidine kinase [Methylocella tundrae]|uniref:Histidine kinase n=1 Tax=Methylocella tundrae TaxID=227605 RepID=A0A4U8YVI8_METTU|nr:histidine kinase [Methylocella tundrae]VFU07267.1 Histidine kinase [Methylocella tundrae]
MPHLTAQNSIRMRLILIPACILSLGIAAVIGVTLYGAKARIASEIDSGLTLGDHLIRYALDDLADARSGDATAQSQALSRLREGLAHVRHIKVAYAAGAAAAPFPESGAPPKPKTTVPAWFQALLRPATIEKIYPVTIGGAPRGEIVMSSEPADEIAEIWSSLLFLTALLIAISIAIVTLILLTARHTLAPLRQLVDGLDRLGRGQFGAVGEIRIAELRRIGEHFNKLAATLARSEDNNHLLIDRLLSIQDAERKELARELHDEFGASLFGVRAAASCIVEAASGSLIGPAEAREIVERAQTISALADAIQKQNYRILDRIRPVILHQMGLPDALRQLAEAWRSQHRDFSCVIDIAGQGRIFNEEVSLTSYRIVQECLTNVARHSKGSAVRIGMSVDAAAAPSGSPELRLRIEDDGAGLPPDFRYGFGFLGMSERVRKLDGLLKIGAGATGGALIEAFIPVGPKAQAETAGDQAGGRRAEETAIP